MSVPVPLHFLSLGTATTMPLGSGPNNVGTRGNKQHYLCCTRHPKKKEQDRPDHGMEARPRVGSPLATAFVTAPTRPPRFESVAVDDSFDKLGVLAEGDLELINNLPACLLQERSHAIHAPGRVRGLIWS
jgi:hypothetical protein